MVGASARLERPRLTNFVRKIHLTTDQSELAEVVYGTVVRQFELYDVIEFAFGGLSTTKQVDATIMRVQNTYELCRR